MILTGTLNSYRMRLWEIVLFSAMIGILATYLHGYYYADSDQLEQLPLIERYLDPEFAPGDYVVDAMSEFSPRIYYIKVIAFLTNFGSLPVIFWLLTCFQHVMVALVTFLVCRRMFPGGDLPAIFSSILVLAVSGPYLGGAAHLFSDYLVPKTLILFLALWCVWEGMNLRPLRCALLSMLGSFIHPAVALHAVVIGLSTTGIALLFRIHVRDVYERNHSIRRWAWLFAGGFLVIGFNIVFWYLPMRGGELSMESLVILTHFRTPHIFLPSHFPVSQYAMALCFVLAAAVMWKWWYDDPATDRYLARRLAVSGTLVLLCLAGGYVFVEVLPTRFWMSAQAFRLMLLLKWFGLMLLGGTVARLLVQNESSPQPSGALFYMTAVGTAQPLLVLLGTVVETVRRRFGAVLGLVGYRGFVIMALLAHVMILIAFKGLRELSALLLFTGIAAGLLYVRKSWLKAGAGLLGVFALLSAVLVNINSVRAPALKKITDKVLVHKQSSYQKNNAALDQAAEFARKHTPRESVFLTPPDFGRFRIKTRRAIVFDFKMVPFREADVQAWLKRLFACYGHPAGTGWTAVEEMREAYRRIEVWDIQRLAREFDATHAVLYHETPTGLPVLYENTVFKLVEIP